jgi:hypothetical protein
MDDVTTFLWVLAVIGAILLAWALALGLSRSTGGHGSTVATPGAHDGKSRYERDNEHPFNGAAFFVALLIVGGLTALALALELS